MGQKWVHLHSIPRTLLGPQGRPRVWISREHPLWHHCSWEAWYPPKPAQSQHTSGAFLPVLPCVIGVKHQPCKDQGRDDGMAPTFTAPPPRNIFPNQQQQQGCTSTQRIKQNAAKWSIIRTAIKPGGRRKAVNSINSANKCSWIIPLCSEPACGRCCLHSFAY